MEYMSKYIYDHFREVIGSKSRFLQKIIKILYSYPSFIIMNRDKKILINN
ncbi:hypothetical protein ES708_20036 [subsurface metagenome]